MKRIIIYGYGKIGKQYIDIVERKLSEKIKIVAICDSTFKDEVVTGKYRFIRPEHILDEIFDEICVCTIYYEEIVRALKDCYKISSSMIRIVNNVPASYLGEVIKNRDVDRIAPDLRELYQFAKKQETVPMFCYEFIHDYHENDIIVGSDQESGLYYGLINGKKVYCPNKYHDKLSVQRYLNSILIEQDPRSPHFYNSDYYLRDGYTCMDIGAAEGIYSLNSISRLKKVYLIEAEEEWSLPLQKTYADEIEKIEIIQKYASNVNDGSEIRLEDYIDDKIDVIKMDIEGAEIKALEGLTGIIERDHPIMEVCTYHNRDDYTMIDFWLKEHGYKTHAVEGYVLCMAMWEIDKEETFDFRHGVIIGEYISA